MTMVGLDLHRRQITFDPVEVESGDVWSGRVWQPDRERFRRWRRDDVTERAHGGPVAIAVEGCNDWRYVVEELVAAGSKRTGGASGHAGGAQPGCRALVERQYGSVTCSPSSCGPSSAIANASPAPNKSCATAAWT
jgi:hypothetical protein